MLTIPDTVDVYTVNGVIQPSYGYQLFTSDLPARKVTQITKSRTYVSTHANTPRPGFVVLGMRCYNGRLWNVVDPNGIATEISANNMDYILRHASLLEGTIDRPCVWVHGMGESRHNLMLVPVGTSIYTDALNNTRLLSTAPTIRDLKLGDTITTYGRVTGVYLGAYGLISSARTVGGQARMRPLVHSRVHTFKTSDGIYYSTRPQILSRDSTASPELTPAAAAALVDASVASGDYFYESARPVSSSLRYLSTPVRRVLKPGRHEISMRLVEIDKAKAEELVIMSFMCRDPGIVILERAGEKYILDICHRHGYTTIADQANSPFDVIPVSVPDTEFASVDVLGQSKSYFRPPSTETVANFDKFYSIEKTVKRSKHTYV